MADSLPDTILLSDGTYIWCVICYIYRELKVMRMQRTMERDNVVFHQPSFFQGFVSSVEVFAADEFLMRLDSGIVTKTSADEVRDSSARFGREEFSRASILRCWYGNITRGGVEARMSRILCSAGRADISPEMTAPGLDTPDFHDGPWRVSYGVDDIVGVIGAL